LDHRSTARWFPSSRSGHADRPIIVLLEQDRADEADDGYRSGSTPDAYDDETMALSLGKMATISVRRLISLRCSIGLVECNLVLGSIRGERHVGEHIGLSLVREGRELGAGAAWAKLVGDLPPLCLVWLRRCPEKAVAMKARRRA
jgi:hypothetical protein